MHFALMWYNVGVTQFHISLFPRETYFGKRCFSLIHIPRDDEIV